MELNDSELKLVNFLIRQLVIGKKYTLREIFDSKWTEVESPTKFGKRFKNAVLNNQIKSLSFISKKTDNHSIYILK